MQTNLINCWTRHIYIIRIWYASSTKLIYSTKMCRKCIWHFWYGSTLNWRLLHVHSCQPLGIGCNLSRPSTTLYFHACACVWLGGEKESVSNLQPISFCAVKKQANRSAWFNFPCLIHHFLAKCSFHSSVHSEMKSWWKQSPNPLVQRLKKKTTLKQQTRRWITDKYPCEIYTWGAP